MTVKEKCSFAWCDLSKWKALKWIISRVIWSINSSLQNNYIFHCKLHSKLSADSKLWFCRYHHLLTQLWIEFQNIFIKTFSFLFCLNLNECSEKCLKFLLWFCQYNLKELSFNFLWFSIQTSTERFCRREQLARELDPDDDDVGQQDEPTQPDVAIRQSKLRRRTSEEERSGNDTKEKG